MAKKVIIIGGGIAGLEAANKLASMGTEIHLFEQQSKIGGNVNNWYQLFPDRRPGEDVLRKLRDEIHPAVKVSYNAGVKSIEKYNRQFTVNLDSGSTEIADAILITTGFRNFDATKKEEYGYGIYDNVITSVDLEKMFREKGTVLNARGEKPKRVGFVHCVGSRDEKAGNNHCSKVCCVTGVKQAIEVREMLPDSEVFCFYMDLRMFGRHYEELYRESQEEWGVKFIRGRLSEACENMDGSILIKVEDTLAGRPMKISVDLLVLLVGFLPSEGTKSIVQLLDLNSGNDGFITTEDEHLQTNRTGKEGIFVAGSCTGSKSIPETLADARAAALEITQYLNINA